MNATCVPELRPPPPTHVNESRKHAVEIPFCSCITEETNAAYTAFLETLPLEGVPLGAEEMTLKGFCVAFFGVLACPYMVFGVAESLAQADVIRVIYFFGGLRKWS